MLDISKSIRIHIYKSPQGRLAKQYVFECLSCKKEMFKTAYYARKSTGHCANCISSIIHTKPRIDIKNQECRICKIIRPSGEFSFRNGLIRSACSHCMNIKHNFNITAADYDLMLTNQNKGCAICKKEISHKHQNGKNAKLAVDHCHLTGKIRGLLCGNCNLGLGNFKDNIGLLKLAIEYLGKKSG
jgi:hypothetical protein